MIYVIIWLLATANAIALFLCCVAFLGKIDGLLVVRRNDRRLADERWQLLQERHDAVIELIAQIPECECGKQKPASDPKPRKKAK